MGKTDENGLGYHITPALNCQSPPEHITIPAYDMGLLGRLKALLFPLRLYEYEGRSKAFAKVLGYSSESTRIYVKPSGDARLTLPVIGAAEKIIAAHQTELAAISAGLAAKRRELEAKDQTRLRGMFEVRPRDSTGVPRNAVGHRRGNAPGFDKF